MKISIIIPTNRASYSAIARVMETASLDPDKFELIVRDNSENALKREILSKIDSPALRLATVPNRGPFENAAEALRLATSEFILFLADDDWISSHGIVRLYELASLTAADPTVACLTGTYLLESSHGTGTLRYTGLDSDDPADRLTSFFAPNNNAYYYSAVRRRHADFCFSFLRRLPYQLSFHDQLASLMYLLLGRTLAIESVFYTYDLTEWASSEKSNAKDQAFYGVAGLPKGYARVHWLLCALEGALLVNSKMLATKVHFDSERISKIWFSMNYGRFQRHQRELDRGDTGDHATLALRDKWLSASDANLNELLLDVCDTLDAHDSAGAKRYFEFWSAL